MQNILSLSAIRSGLLLLTIMVSTVGLQAQAPVQSDQNTQGTETPVLIGQGAMFADIDTVNQVIYMMYERDLWKYDLNEENWDLLHTYEQQKINTLFEHPKEFGYDYQTESLYFWSRGVGVVCRIDLKDYTLKRVDQSFQHKNQFSHVPFIRDGMIYAFGGYGFWEDKNLITSYAPELKEWKIVSPAEESPFPEARVGGRGVYVDSMQSFFLAFGSVVTNRDHSDGNSIRKKTNDLWKFDFRTMTWSYLMDLTINDNWHLPGPVISSESTSGTSSLTSSAYSDHTNNWYIPVKTTVGSKPSIFLKVVDLQREQEYQLIELHDPIEEEMIATNFMFDQKSQELILLGYRNMTNSEIHPMMVVKVPESELLKQLKPINDSRTLIYGSLVAFGILLALGWLFVKYNGVLPGVNGADETGIDLDRLKGELNKTERSLVKALINSDHMPETSELEEMIWPDVDNYDYRRKLRNETIRSINNKVKESFDIKEDLIIRQRDLEDNRRFRYGVNEELLG